MADTLETHLNAAAQALSGWMELEKTTLDETKQKCLEEIEKDRQQLLNLEAQKAQLAAMASHRDENLSEKLRLIQANQSEVRVLQAEMATSEPVVLNLRAQKALHDEKMSIFTKDTSQASNTHSQIVAELQKCIDNYRKLGLVIDRKDENNLVFIFTQIDREVPSREFSFTLRINPSNEQFIVENCSPPINEKENLLTALNETGNLSLFIRSMRKLFQKLVVEANDC